MHQEIAYKMEMVNDSESVVALLMFVTEKLRKHVCNLRCLNVYVEKVTAERQYRKPYQYQCYKIYAELEANIDGIKVIKKLILE